MKRNVGILIFNEAEVLDFAGPFEVFSVTSELNNYKLFNVFTIAKELKPISAVNGLSINPKFDFNNCPPIDILIISGGIGTVEQMKDHEILNWIKKIHENTEFTLSICSGSRLLGALGVLDNQPYCTHKDVYKHMSEIVTNGFPQKSKRFVSSNKVYTSGGISAGIDLSFHIVEKLHGKEIAKKTAEYMEYSI
ncbi:AraC family transcriptional regulator [Flavobacterium sp. 316]|uniref:DJ-1/PfpI family protein n=1 Tax=Flavobacterium sp. 316 TaxID=1603293 RepID=UPI0005E05DCA|nr:DJ-1/PfpI family protein [Flavobacterium sp. 316]KIX22705.1 AraC family transcriptional regulator [Flavobacterium sp. 316]